MRHLFSLVLLVVSTASAQTNPLDPGPVNPLDAGAATGNSPDAPAVHVPSFPVTDASGRAMRQWGNVVFALEPQWEATVRDGICIVRPEKWIDLDDHLEIRILPSEPFNGSVDELQAWARERVDLDFKTKSDDPMKIDLVKWSNLTQPVGPITLFSGGIAKEVEGRSQEIALVTALRGGNQANVIVGVFEKPDAANERSAAFAKFIESVQLVSITGRPLLGKPSPGPLDGVYWGTYTTWLVGLDGMMRMNLTHVRYTFYPSGRFFADIPPDGVGDFDFDKLQPRHGDELGNYYVANGKVHLHFADGTAQEMQFVNADELTFGQANLFKTDLPPDGYRFEGTRDWMFYSGFTPGVIQGGMSAWNSTLFKKDGTYVTDAGSGASGNFTDGAGGTTGGFAVGSEDKSKTGRYEVKGGRLFLKGDDGSERDYAIIVTREEQKSIIWIGDQYLKTKE